MQPHAFEYSSGEVFVAGHMSYDFDLHSRLAAFLEYAHHLLIRNVHVINQQFPLGSLDESLQRRPRVDRAYQKLAGQNSKFEVEASNGTKWQEGL